MPRKAMYGSKSLPDARSPASSKPHPPLPDDNLSRSAGEAKVDANAGRVLIVDDDPGVLALLSKMAASLGYHPTIAEDAVEALSYLANDRYDLVITDYDMPFIDGYQLADQIKEKYIGTPVIIMTGHCASEVIDMLDGSFIVDGLLFKPFNLKIMQEKIEMVRHPRCGRSRS